MAQRRCKPVAFSRQAADLVHKSRWRLLGNFVFGDRGAHDAHDEFKLLVSDEVLPTVLESLGHPKSKRKANNSSKFFLSHIFTLFVVLWN